MKITKETAEKIIKRLDFLENKCKRKRYFDTWTRGVDDYARWRLQMVLDDETDENKDYKSLDDFFLNGATDFKDLSYGGNYYIYDEDIAEALAAPSKRRYSKRTGAVLPPNSRESWLDVQKRALRQACEVIAIILRDLQYLGEVD